MKAGNYLEAARYAESLAVEGGSRAFWLTQAGQSPDTGGELPEGGGIRQPGTGAGAPQPLCRGRNGRRSPGTAALSGSAAALRRAFETT